MDTGDYLFISSTIMGHLCPCLVVWCFSYTFLEQETNNRSKRKFNLKNIFDKNVDLWGFKQLSTGQTGAHNLRKRVPRLWSPEWLQVFSQTQQVWWDLHRLRRETGPASKDTGSVGIDTGPTVESTELTGVDTRHYHNKYYTQNPEGLGKKRKSRSRVKAKRQLQTTWNGLGTG